MDKPLLKARKRLMTLNIGTTTDVNIQSSRGAQGSSIQLKEFKLTDLRMDSPINRIRRVEAIDLTGVVQFRTVFTSVAGGL